MTTLATFPMTVEPLHSTGANVVRCPALGTRDVYLTDDFGAFVPAPCLPRIMFAHTSNGEH